MQRSTEDDQRLNVLGKALVVLEAVTDHPQGIGLPDLLRDFRCPGRPCIACLCNWRLLASAPRQCPRAFHHWSPFDPPFIGCAGCQQQLGSGTGGPAGIVDEIGETCNLGVLEGLDYIYIERIECEWPLRIHLGGWQSHAGPLLSGGRCSWPTSIRSNAQALLRSRKLAARTSRSITSVADLEAELEKVRVSATA